MLLTANCGKGFYSNAFALLSMFLFTDFSAVLRAEFCPLRESFAAFLAKAVYSLPHRCILACIRYIVLFYCRITWITNLRHKAACLNTQFYIVSGHGKRNDIPIFIVTGHAQSLSIQIERIICIISGIRIINLYLRTVRIG